MMGRTHSILGSGMFLAVGFLQHIPKNQLYWGMAIAGLFALMPDIDTTKSWIGKRLWFISVPLSRIVRHRGATHSLVALGIFLVILFIGFLYHPEWIYLYQAAWIGYFSHVLGDYLTKEGVSLFWPNIKRYRLGKGLFATNSVGEQIFLVIISIIFWGLFYCGR